MAFRFCLETSALLELPAGLLLRTEVLGYLVVLILPMSVFISDLIEFIDDFGYALCVKNGVRSLE